MRAKVFSYYTLEERRLLEEAANRESRSLSSFVALAALDRARRVRNSFFAIPNDYLCPFDFRKVGMAHAARRP